MRSECYRSLPLGTNEGDMSKKGCKSVFPAEVTTLRNASFEIFSGAADEDPVWLETVERLSRARERMQQIAAEIPGRYFLLSATSHSILAQIWTFKRFSHTLKIITVARGAASPQG
jgi:hypothetical protein